MTRDTRVPLLKIFLSAGFFVFLFSCSFEHVHAQEFSSEYAVTYDVQEDGITRVTQEVSLTNLTSEFYASEYTLFVHAPDVENVIARDGGGFIEPEFEHEDERTRIRVLFNEKIVGEGNTQTFTIAYDDASIMRQHGLVREVIIPRLADGADVASYTVIVRIPDAFGAETVVHPVPQGRARDDDAAVSVFTFDHEAIRTAGALLTFGDEQYYHLDLHYHLQNPRSGTIRTQIALPPDVAGQQEVQVDLLEPAPLTVERDADGNYLAMYELAANEQRDIRLTGVIHVTQHETTRSSSAGIDQIPEAIRDTYTGPLPFWPADDDFLAGVAREVIAAAGNPTSVYAQALALYDYVTTTLTYSTDRLQQGDVVRFGALKALQEAEQAVCMEYTDLLVTLARSVGIPAREVDGYAYTPDVAYLPTIGDVLHAWVELYIPPVGWVPVDPTWGSTTEGVDYFNRFDVNHIYFSIKGLDSEWPYPAGAYKLSPDQVGDINVRFATEEEITSFTEVGASFITAVETDEAQVAGLPLTGVVTVTNTSSRTLYEGEVSVSRAGGTEESYRETIAVVPPYGSVTVPFSIERTSVWRGGAQEVVVDASFANGVNETGDFATVIRTIPWIWGVIVLIALLLGGVMLRYVIVRRVATRLPSL